MALSSLIFEDLKHRKAEAQFGLRLRLNCGIATAEGMHKEAAMSLKEVNNQMDMHFCNSGRETAPPLKAGGQPPFAPGLAHSSVTFSKPQRRNWRKPLACLSSVAMAAIRELRRHRMPPLFGLPCRARPQATKA
jgi:hypothetical protein